MGSYGAESKTLALCFFILKRLYDLVAVFISVTEKGLKLCKLLTKGKSKNDP